MLCKSWAVRIGQSTVEYESAVVIWPGTNFACLAKRAIERYCPTFAKPYTLAVITFPKKLTPKLYFLMVVFGIVILVLIFIFYCFTKKWDAEAEKEKAQQKDFETKEMKRLNLSEEGYKKHLFYTLNGEKLKEECLKQIVIPKITSLLFTDYWEGNTQKLIFVTYDETNKSKLWQSNLILPFLFNCETIVVYKQFDYEKLIKAFDAEINSYHTYSSYTNKQFTIDNFLSKTINLIDVLKSKDKNTSLSLYSLAEENLDATIIQDYNEKSRWYSRETGAINRWAYAKGNVAASKWADKKTETIGTTRQYINAHFQAKAIFFLYKKFAI